MKTATSDEVTVPLAWISAALDEIWMLRRLAADEALIRQRDLDLRTFPQSRRATAEACIRRLRQAARGDVSGALRGISWATLDIGMRQAEAPTTLTRHQWETEKGLATPRTPSRRTA